MSYDAAKQKIAEKVGETPIIGSPQITDTCVYQCAEVAANYGKTIAFRKWNDQHETDKWWLADFSCGTGFDQPLSCNKEWDAAKAQFKVQCARARWRGDDKVELYFSTPWNVQDILQCDGIGWIYGAPGSYKTVMAMDMACCIATGRPWCGRETRQGPVLYISAEGGAGIYAMRNAWECKNQTRADNLAIYDDAPDMSAISLSTGYGEHGKTYPHRIAQILREFQTLLNEPAALIVIDTYAQTSADDTKAAVTAYENNLRNMIRLCAPGASALVIDHTTKEGNTWMGSNAKLGNMDMMGFVKRAGDDIILTMRGGKGKVKNAPAFPDVRMTPHLVDLGRKDAYGREASAPVLDYCKTVLTERETLLLELVGDNATYQDVRTAWHDHPANKDSTSQARKASLSRAIRALRQKEAVGVEGLEYDQTEDGTKERPMSDTCLLFPL